MEVEAAPEKIIRVHPQICDFTYSSRPRQTMAPVASLENDPGLQTQRTRTVVCETGGSSKPTYSGSNWISFGPTRPALAW